MSWNVIENEDIVIDFEGFTYNNLILKELTVYEKKFRHTTFQTTERTAWLQLHKNAQ